MDADVAVTDPRGAPITHPRDRSISVHLRQRFSCLRRWLRVCDASPGFADITGSLLRCTGRGSALGHAQGSRFKGSIRNGLNGVVEPVFAIGSRFKGSVRNGLNGAVGPGFTVGSRFKGSIRDGLNGAVGPGVGAPCGGRLAGARSPAATARLGLPRGLVAVGAVCDIAGFPAVCLTDMVGVPNRSNREPHSVATARSAPWLQRRGRSLGPTKTWWHTWPLAGRCRAGVMPKGWR